MLLALHIAYI